MTHALKKLLAPEHTTADRRLDLQRAPAMVRALYYTTLDLSEADLYFLFRRLDELVTRGELLPDDPMAAWALEGVAACAAELDLDYVSCTRYGHWHRHDLEDRSAYPTDNQIRRIFGGWIPAGALQAGRPQVDVKAVRSLRRARGFTKAGLLRSAEAWKAQLPTDAVGTALGLVAFQDWAAERRADPECDLQLPRTKTPWADKFGGWPYVLNELGLWHARLCGPKPQRPTVWRYEGSKQEIVEWIRRTPRGAHGRPTYDGYEHWIYSEIVEAAQRGEVLLRVPSLHVVTKAFGSWTAAVDQAGFPPLTRTPPPQAGIGDAALFDALSACATNSRLGAAGPTSYRYKKWHEQLPDSERRARPTQGSFFNRFDTWDAALTAWREQLPAPGQPTRGADSVAMLEAAA